MMRYHVYQLDPAAMISDVAIDVEIDMVRERVCVLPVEPIQTIPYHEWLR
jgi:hypothetical protein